MMANQELGINGSNILESLTNNRHFRSIHEENSNKNWLPLTKISYLDQRGVPRIWADETVVAAEAEAKVEAAVCVIAFYRRRLHFDCIILVKQYRPALNAFTIEMPSGFLGDNETYEKAATRELHDCTGFNGSVKKIGPMLAMEPSSSNCAMRLVTIEVNGDDQMNVHMNTQTIGDRFKEPLIIPVSELLDKLTSYANAGFIVDSRIDSFAIGLVMGNNSRKSKIPSTLVS